MLQKIDKFRFYVADDKGKKRSSVWFISFGKDDSIYIGPQSIGGKLKLSIHPIEKTKDRKNAQIGFKNDYAREARIKGFNIFKAIRWSKPIPKKNEVIYIASIYFPTDYLKGEIKEALIGDKNTKFALQMANIGSAVEVDLLCSLAPISEMVKLSVDKKIVPIFGASFDSGENIIICARHVLFDPKLIPNLNNGKLCPLEGAPKPGTSIKNLNAVLHSAPKDGERIFLAEINGIEMMNRK